MAATDEDALICDFAETYHILDYRALPIETAAVLASGLRDDSRIKMKISGFRSITQEILLAHVVDRLTIIAYGLRSGKEKHLDPPKMMLDIITGNDEGKEKVGYSSGAEYEEARAKILQKIKEENDG